MAGRELLDEDASAQLSALATRRVSAVELLKASLARHEQTHARLNAVIAADLQQALDRARAIDDIRGRGGHLGPLAGLPLTVKDTLDVDGMPASAGLSRRRGRKVEDAVAVRHVRNADAVIWGKTNVPVRGGDWQAYNRAYGTTSNPWDLKRTSGGSSGGAASAVAAGVTALEIADDIGGSLRVPASFCGLFAHKPTWGLVSQYGLVPPDAGSRAELDLTVIGPLARSARDLRLLLSVIENGPLAPRAPPASLKETRIALWVDEPAFPVDPEVRATILRFGQELAEAGAVVEPITRPIDATLLLESTMVLLGAILGSRMGAGEAFAMGLLRGPAKLAKALGAPPYAWPTMARAYTARHREWMAADAVRQRLRHEIQGVFQRFDVILAPAAPTTAFPHDHSPIGRRKLKTSDGARIPYLSILGWQALASACHLPVTTVPAGLAASGLPVGAQLIGPHGGDAKTLAVAQAIDESVRGFEPPPLD
jgi:amidase